MPDHNYFSTLIWQIADLLRGPYAIRTLVAFSGTPNNAAPRTGLAMTCMQQHLSREIAFWKARYIVGLGTKVCGYLSRCNIPHDELPHPSHREDKDFHKPFVAKLQAKLNRLP